MVAALKSEVVTPHPAASNSIRTEKNRLKVLSDHYQSTATLPVNLSTKRRYPLWLKAVILGQRVSAGLAVLSVAGALLAYGLTVNTNRKLTLATSTLENLQAQQQQLVAANAVFKNHIAETALTTLDANTLHPRNVLFVEADATTATSSEAKSAAPEGLTSETNSTENQFFPQGY